MNRFIKLGIVSALGGIGTFAYIDNLKLKNKELITDLQSN